MKETCKMLPRKQTASRMARNCKRGGCLGGSFELQRRFFLGLHNEEDLPVEKKYMVNQVCLVLWVGVCFPLHLMRIWMLCSPGGLLVYTCIRWRSCRVNERQISEKHPCDNQQ
uniref:Transmembrane protein n=1 Tax=Leersia perrieri TaxID=77586 RepID=A0A0D9VVI0_9ORYZ